MKTRNILITLTLAAMASVNAMAVDALLSPRAENQSKVVRGVNSDPNIAAPGLTPLSPRMLDNESKTVAGKSAIETPSTVCLRHMAGTPKMIGACTEHSSGSMSCCSVPDKK